MGDRVYASITFGGHIETVEEAEEFISSLGLEHIVESDRDKVVSSEDEAKASLRYLIEHKSDVQYYDNECNYGTFDDLETMVAKIPGLGCSTQFDAGGGFDAGVKTIMPDGSEHSANYSRDGGATVSLSDLKQARNSDSILVALDKLIADAENAQGSKLPDLTVSPAVAAWLKIFAEKAA